MKSRIGTINRKPIVQGDKNLVTPNEIHVSELGEGGEQSDIPVEYYKVVAPEGENLNDIRETVAEAIGFIYSSNLNFTILIKGTSSSNSHRLYTGINIGIAYSVIENTSIHAYAFIPIEIPNKTINTEGKLTETPSFNNIFDAVELLVGEENISRFKEALIPITAEEFYNLDDLK